jgi:hypothetical protein
MPGPERSPFERALEEARRNGRAGGGAEGSIRLERPYVRASEGLERANGGGGEERWELAFAWTGDPNEPPGPLTPAPGQRMRSGPDTADEIAKELGVGGALTLTQLAFLWRDFVWRNHPDRQPAHARERANARVAIANGLYDRARRELAKAR